MEALEGTAAEQETRLTAAEENIQGNYINELLDKQSKESTTTILFERFEFLGKKITGIKLLNITFYTGLQAADVSFDARITALEENMGSTSNGKFYFA